MESAFRLAAPRWGLVALVTAFACVSARGGQDGQEAQDPYTDPAAPPRLFTEGEIRAEFKEELKLLGITAIPPETDSLVPGVFLNIDEVPGLKGVLRGGFHRAVLGEDGKPLHGAWSTDLRWSPSGLPKAPTIPYGFDYASGDGESAPVPSTALTVRITVHQRSPRDALLQLLADVAGANERPTRSTFAAPAIGDVAAVHERLEPVEGGGTVRTLQRMVFVRHNIAVFISTWNHHVLRPGEPTPTQAAEAVARHLDGLIKDSPRYQSIAASGLAPIIDELRVAGVEGDLLEPDTKYQVVVKSRDLWARDVPPDNHLSLAGMRHLWSVGAWQDSETGVFWLDVGSEPPPERLLRLRVVNLRGCMTEKIVRYRVNVPAAAPKGEGSGR